MVNDRVSSPVGEEVDWDSEEGERLLHLVVPSAEQTNFSIGERWPAQASGCECLSLPTAHEVAHLQHKDALYHVLLSPITLVVSYHIATMVPRCKVYS